MNYEPKNEKIEIIYDQDPTLGYEKSKWQFFLMLPLMYLMTCLGCLQFLFFALLNVIFRKNKKPLKPQKPGIFFHWSSICHKISQNWGTHIALDLVYNVESKILFLDSFFDYFMTKFWLLWVMLNPKAVRNRLRLLKRELNKAVEEQITRNHKNKIRVLVVACGSAPAEIECASYFKEKGVEVELSLLDLSLEALDFCEKQAQEKGINIKRLEGKASAVVQLAPKGIKYDIIEMVGFGDYLRPHKYVLLLNLFQELLQPNGIIITANIIPNLEKPFMDWVVGWPMIYKKPEQMAQILLKANLKNSIIYIEPQYIHMIAISYL